MLLGRPLPSPTASHRPPPPLALPPSPAALRSPLQQCHWVRSLPPIRLAGPQVRDRIQLLSVLPALAQGLAHSRYPVELDPVSPAEVARLRGGRWFRDASWCPGWTTFPGLQCTEASPECGHEGHLPVDSEAEAKWHSCCVWAGQLRQASGSTRSPLGAPEPGAIAAVTWGTGFWRQEPLQGEPRGAGAARSEPRSRVRLCTRLTPGLRRPPDFPARCA